MKVLLLFVLGFGMALSSAVGRQPKALYISNKSLDGTKPNSLLDTFSLSFVGSFDFARTFEGFNKIFEGISSCKFERCLVTNLLQVHRLVEEAPSTIHETDINPLFVCLALTRALHSIPLGLQIFEPLYASRAAEGHTRIK